VSPAGKKAAQRARLALERQGHDPDLMDELVNRYARAVDDAANLRKQWETLGSPGLAEGGATGSAQVAHPLLKQVQEAEKLAALFGADCGLTIKAKRGPGRPVASDRKLPPKLSVVS
jgi:hypothetical protein